MDENEEVKNETTENVEVKAENNVNQNAEVAQVMEQLKNEEGYTANGVVNNQSSSNSDIIQKKISVLGLISFIFALVGLIVAGIPCGIVALITGIIGLVRFDAKKETCRWMAVTGVSLGAIDIVFVVLYMMITAVSMY